MQHPHREPEGGVAVAAVDLGERLLPEAGDGHDEGGVARLPQVGVHHRFKSTERRTPSDDLRPGVGAAANSRMPAGEGHLGPTNPSSLAGRHPPPRTRGGRRRSGSGARRRVSIPPGMRGGDRPRHLEDGVGLAGGDVVGARPGRCGASSASTFARATSVTCTKSRSCPPSSNTFGARPAASALRKMLATPA